MFHNRYIDLTCLKVQVVGVTVIGGPGFLGVFARAGTEGERVAFAANLDAARKGKGFAAFRLLRETQERIDVDGTKLARVRLHLFDQEPNHPLTHGFGSTPQPEIPGLLRLGRRKRRSHQISKGDAPFAAVLCCGEKEAELGGAFEPGVFFASQIGQPGKVLDNSGLKSSFKKGQQPRANTGAQAAGVAVGSVFAPGLAAKTKIRAQILAAKFEQGTESGAGLGVNAGESGKTGSAEHVGENGFSLVVGGVSDGDFVEMMVAGEVFKEGVTGTTSGVFDVGMFAPGFGGDVFARREKRKIVVRGERGDEFFVGVGGATAQLVIEVDDRKDDAKLFAKFEEKKKEGDRIGTAGDGHANALARVGATVKAQGVQELLSESGALRRLGWAVGHFSGHGLPPLS